MPDTDYCPVFSGQIYVHDVAVERIYHSNIAMAVKCGNRRLFLAASDSKPTHHSTLFIAGYFHPMSPPLLTLSDIFLTFGGHPLLEGASLSVSAGERICLVGRNGSGKSTLLKIASGIVESDRGARFFQPGTTVRYLPQEPDLSKYKSIQEYVVEGLAPGDDHHLAELLMADLGLDGASATTNLSGGELRRAALVRTLASEPDILLLDEPTNHLDLPAIEWLENWLRRCKSALVLISHDRRFLSNLSRRTVWMDRGQTRLLDKGFAEFEDWRDNLLEEEEMQRHKLGRKIVREEHWITHGVSGRRKRNVRRLKEVGNLKTRKSDERKQPKLVNITVAEGEASGKLVAKIHQVSKSFDDLHVVRELSMIIQRGDRIGLVGPNGAGKTTIVNLICGKLLPDAGKIKHGVNLNWLLIDQKREMLDPDWTLKDALTDGSGDMVAIGDELKHYMSYMKDFLFLPEQARTPLHVLSGGERGRLMLARGFRHPSNVLVLDEPTNDLDLETLDLLQEKIADYEGTVIVVSHDRDFLDRVCTSVVASDGDGVWAQYAGGYGDMVSQRGHGVQAKIKGDSKTYSASRKKPGAPKAEKPKREMSFSQRHALDTLPKEIERLEFEISKLRVALEDQSLYSRDRKKFNAWSKALSEREKKLVKKEDQWLELESLREAVEG